MWVKSMSNNKARLIHYSCFRFRSFDFFVTKTFTDSVCVQYAAGMAAASQTIIVKAALSYQDIYEVWHYVKALQ